AHWFVAVDREALQRVGRSLLRHRFHADQRERRDAPSREAAKDARPCFHRAPALATGLSLCGIITTVTPPSNRTTLPESRTSSRFALMVPCCIITSTGFSETMWLVRTLTTASMRRAWSLADVTTMLSRRVNRSALLSNTPLGAVSWYSPASFVSNVACRSSRSIESGLVMSLVAALAVTT